MSRATRSALIIATGTLAGSSAGFGVWQVTGFQAVWFSLLLDVAGVLGVAGLVEWRRKWRAAAKVISDSSYHGPWNLITRTGAGAWRCSLHGPVAGGVCTACVKEAAAHERRCGPSMACPHWRVSR